MDVATQGTYLMGLIHVGRVNRRKQGTYDDPSHSHRQATIHYTVPVGTGILIIRFCKNNFVNIFTVTRKRLFIIILLIKEGENVQILFRDILGKFQDKI